MVDTAYWLDVGRPVAQVGKLGPKVAASWCRTVFIA